MANADVTKTYEGHYEIVSLVGTIDPDGQHHMHISISDADGNVFGGHVFAEHIIYTTGKLRFGMLLTKDSCEQAEIVVGTNDNEHYSRQECPLSGWPELVVTPK